MNKAIGDIFTLSIAIAAIIGWIRFKKINPAYYPFLFLIWIGLINELISIAIIYIVKGNSTALNNNLYSLLESLIITWQFKKWKLFHQASKLFLGIIIVFILLWGIEVFFIADINHTGPYFRVTYSFIIILMSLSMINIILANERKNILKNPIFLICLAFSIYFTYSVIIWSFWLYGLSLSKEFLKNLTAILFYINLFSNLIYALAVLWMPTKHRFSLPS